MFVGGGGGVVCACVSVCVWGGGGWRVCARVGASVNVCPGEGVGAWGMGASDCMRECWLLIFRLLYYTRL